MTAIEFRHKLIDLQKSLMGFAYSLTGDNDDAKDLVQETSLKTLKYRDKFMLESNFKAWTFTIMKNTFINNYRKSILQNTYRDQSEESFFINQTKSSVSENPESIYSVLEMTQNIEQLEDKLRIPLEMYLNGYKYKEIADKLCLNVGTVKSRIFTSRKKLRDTLNR